MESTQFVVLHLDAAGATDLGNALTSVNGVARVGADLPSGRVTVEYDPAYSNPEIIEGNVKGSGYPIESSTAKT